MTYVVVWRTEALQQLRSLRASDAAAAKIVMGAVSALAANPSPAASVNSGKK